jgi:C4-dicarboxylate transporter, DctM subunit
MVILLEAALVSPLEGLNLYVIHGIRKSVAAEAGTEAGTMIDLWLGVLPFMIGMAIVIALIIQFPHIALWLPDLVEGK